MTQTTNPFLDELAKVMTDMAGLAQGARREVETAMRSRAESFLADMDLVKREDIDVLRDMAAKAREENERLADRLAALEARVALIESGKSPLAETLVAGGPADAPAVG